MFLKNTDSRYGLIAQALHWSIAVLIIVQFVLAEIFEDLPLSLEKIALILRHKSIGMTILLLAVVRVVWRFINAPPPLPDNLRRYEYTLAKVTHVVLYILIFAIPLSGWCMSSFANIPVEYFGMFAFPDFVQPSKPLVDVAKEVHEFLATALVVLLVLHIAAALKHHFIMKDDVLKRMLPFR